MADPETSGKRARPRPVAAPARKPQFATWSKIFLAHLAATSNISAAARAARVNTFVVYETRRTDAEFNRRWMQALCEGYDHLEMALLHRLREGEVKPAPGAKKGSRSFDNGTAFRLLAAHRESAARQRAVRDNDDAEAILAGIDAKLETMRARWLAAQGLSDDAES